MDLGATICLPGKPKCQLCPIQHHCLAFERGVQEQRPVMPEKKPLPHHIVTAAIIYNDNGFLLAQRPNHGLLGGLWEFPGGKQETGESLEETIRREIKEELGCEIQVESYFGEYLHAYTHFRITLHAYFCKVIQGEPQPLEATQIIWSPLNELINYPMGKIDRQIAERLQKHFSRSL